jgi:hypothetical protein
LSGIVSVVGVERRLRGIAKEIKVVKRRLREEEGNGAKGGDGAEGLNGGRNWRCANAARIERDGEER